MRCERRLDSVLYRNWYLPESTISVQSREYIGVAKRVYALVDPRDKVVFLDGEVVQPPVVHIETSIASFLGTRTMGDAHSDDEGWITPALSIRWTSFFSNSLPAGACR